MSSPDDRDLAAAFEELTAPPATANYATRTPSQEFRTSPRRWPQVLATALAVLVAAAGATTFLALRSARQGGGPSSSPGAPPARAGAAMAYDSTAGVTVMFGGLNSSGHVLTDTWTWDGSAWTGAAAGPGSLVGTRLVDDPADGGVLLLGMQASATNGTGVTTGSGCAVGSSTGGGASGSATGAPGATAAPGRTPVRPTGPPLNDPLPSVAPPPPATATCEPAVSSPPVAALASAQTWVFNSSGWHRAATGSALATPPAGAQLTFDPTTRQVVAFSAGFSCGPPLEGAVSTGAPIACPMVESSGAAATSTIAPCAQPVGCVPTETISTWTWSGGSWKNRPASGTLTSGGIPLLLADPATQHATLMTQVGTGLYGGMDYPMIGCPAVKSCPAAPAPEITTYTWTGTTWKQVSQVPTPQQAPDLAAATIAVIEGHIVALTSTGQTWTFAAGQWTEDTPSRHPDPRSGAAAAEGPGSTVVLFGGAASSGVFVAAAAPSVGSDTWLWNGQTWQQRGGAAPSPAPTPSTFPCGTQGKTVIPPCVQLLPAEVPPAGPLTPQTTP